MTTKHIFLCLISALLLLVFLCGCTMDTGLFWGKNDPLVLSEKEEAKLIDTIYRLNYESASGSTSKDEIISGIKILYYLGEYNGAHVVQTEELPNRIYAQWVATYQVEGKTFTSGSSCVIQVYTKDAYYTLQEAVEKGILSAEDIATIHDRWERAIEEMHREGLKENMRQVYWEKHFLGSSTPYEDVRIFDVCAYGSSYVIALIGSKDCTPTAENVLVYDGGWVRIYSLAEALSNGVITAEVYEEAVKHYESFDFSSLAPPIN